MEQLDSHRLQSEIPRQKSPPCKLVVYHVTSASLGDVGVGVAGCRLALNNAPDYAVVVPHVAAAPGGTILPAFYGRPRCIDCTNLVGVEVVRFGCPPERGDSLV